MLIVWSFSLLRVESFGYLNLLHVLTQVFEKCRHYIKAERYTQSAITFQSETKSQTEVTLRLRALWKIKMTVFWNNGPKGLGLLKTDKKQQQRFNEQPCLIL